MKKFFPFCFLFFIIPLIPYAQFDNNWEQKVDPIVLKKSKSETNTEFIIVMEEQAELSKTNTLKTKEEKGLFVYNTLVETATRTQKEVIQILRNKNALFQSYWVANVIWVNGDISIIQEIAPLSAVKEIIENASYTFPKPIENIESTSESRTIEWGITKTQADKVWALGYTGQGIVIGGDDTGYDWTHPALKKKYRGWNGTSADHNYNWHDAVKSGNGGACGINALAPCDDFGHGTHTMGTMVGDDEAGNQIGMAPGASWIGCRNMDVGNGTFTMYVECFQFFLAPTDLTNSNANPLKSPHVINNSWGCIESEGCNSSNYATMETVIKNLNAAGIVVVSSSGNSGPNCSTIDTPPSIFANSFVVGSTTNSDEISSFSSRGPITIYSCNEVKPDVTAPGTGIRSSYKDGTYSTMSGTSMAGPHVAGLVALIISANPELAGQVDSIENIIRKTATPLTSTENCGSISGSLIPNYTFGHGRIDALAAVNMAVSIKETEKKEFPIQIYPNPCSDYISVEFQNKQANAFLHVYNNMGQLVLDSKIEPFKKINISALSEGVFFYVIETETIHFNGKLVKIK